MCNNTVTVDLQYVIFIYSQKILMYITAGYQFTRCVLCINNKKVKNFAATKPISHKECESYIAASTAM